MTTPEGAAVRTPDLVVSSSAQRALEAELTRSGRKAVRLLPLGGASHGLGLAVSLTRTPSEGDLEVRIAGLPFCVAPDFARLFDGLELDYTGSAFIFRQRGGER